MNLSWDKPKVLSRIRADENGCWIWTGYVSKSGYGRAEVKVDGTWRTLRAHRLAYMLFVGEIVDGLLVCHRCDVRACVNPEHLFLGTDRDNAYDCIDKGRQRATLCKTKLTADQVVAIRESTDSHSVLGARFGVARATIGKIKNGIRWRRSAS